MKDGKKSSSSCSKLSSELRSPMNISSNEVQTSLAITSSAVDWNVLSLIS